MDAVEFCPIQGGILGGSYRDATVIPSSMATLRGGYYLLMPKQPVLLGIPFDANSSYLRGTAGAPPLIRKAMRCDASNLWAENGADLGTTDAYVDAGDLTLENATGSESAFTAITAAIDQLLSAGQRPVSLGGDHSITFPILRGFSKHFRDLTIIHFDAHPDLYDEFEGSRVSHACPFARVMEGGHAKRLIQLGIRAMTGHQRQQAARFGVEVYEMKDLLSIQKSRFDGPVYISFDVDVLDPAFAPGISHREPGGMSVREALNHLHAIDGEIIGADLVEFNPTQDISGVTATVCGKLLKEILGKMIAG